MDGTSVAISSIHIWILLSMLEGISPCPVINIDRGTGPDANGYPRVTTIIQSDQVRQIFDNVTNVLLQDQEKRFMNILDMNNVVRKPTDCQDVHSTVGTQSGVYTIYPVGTSPQGVQVFCDMETDGGGWTVMQRRLDGSVDFNRDWNDYLVGFGSPNHEYWLGNQLVHLITTTGWYELRIDMWNHAGEHKHVRYSVFSISDNQSGYKLFLDGFHGDAGLSDDLAYVNGLKFTTKDRDQDEWSSNCAVTYEGGFWYKSCHYASSLNSPYGKINSQGIHWHSWDQHTLSMTKAEMKIRRHSL